MTDLCDRPGLPPTSYPLLRAVRDAQAEVDALRAQIGDRDQPHAEPVDRYAAAVPSAVEVNAQVAAVWLAVEEYRADEEQKLQQAIKALRSETAVRVARRRFAAQIEVGELWAARRAVADQVDGARSDAKRQSRQAAALATKLGVAERRLARAKAKAAWVYKWIKQQEEV